MSIYRRTRTPVQIEADLLEIIIRENTLGRPFYIPHYGLIPGRKTKRRFPTRSGEHNTSTIARAAVRLLESNRIVSEKIQGITCYQATQKGRDWLQWTKTGIYDLRSKK